MITAATLLSDSAWAKVDLAERYLRQFIMQAWHVIEPATEFKPNWHIDAICDHLIAVDRLEIRNLLVTMPPRMMKSISISVMYPAWKWITDPAMRFMYASYSEPLSTSHSVATRRIIESDWYQNRWGSSVQLAGDANLKTRFENTKTGARFSTSIGGVTTGMGGNRLVVDDPHNVLEGESEAKRLEAITWWDQAMSTRFNDPLIGCRIIVMQRVHELDLAGHVIEQGGYVHLNLPMEYEPKRHHFTGFGIDDPRTKAGELLFPNRIGQPEVEGLKRILGPRAYAGQFQQRPSPAEGAILKKGWWRYYEPSSIRLNEFWWLLQSWDTAFKTKEENDYSVCLTAAIKGRRIYILEVYRAKLIMPDLKIAARSQFEKWRPHEVIIEDKASGQSLIQELQYDVPEGEYDPRFVRSMPVDIYKTGILDKVQRAHNASPQLAAGRLYLPMPHKSHWDVEAFVEELNTFPGGAHDDQVDAYSQAVLRFEEKLELFQDVDPAIISAFDPVAVA
jgi:predicted phage terminase large subunit-like protein